MKPLCADTFYYFALLIPRDPAHSKAVAATERLKCPIVTTAWVLTELGNAMASPENRGVFVSFADALERNPDVTIVPPSRSLFTKGMSLYRKRQDKSWSLTDSISFIVMEQCGIKSALTGDHHFEQAGFRVLLK
jgi:predicted nucleic acid-binding protein